MTDPTPSVEQVLSGLLGRLHRLNRVAAGRTSAGHSPTVYRTLGLVIDSGPIRIGELADAVHLSQPGMTKVVHSLEQLGAVSRSSDPSDQRVSLVQATDHGRDLLAQRTSQIVDQLLPDFASLTPAERQILADAVDILTRYSSTDEAVSTAPTQEQM